jgi:phosphatidylserine/phosphatidylglycerophosphate/cardiolipin synthase-like enzyme
MKTTRATLWFLAVCLLSACSGKSSFDGYFHRLETYIGDASGVQRLITDLGTANQRVDVALTHLEHPDLIEALLAVERRGVELRVVGDADFAQEDGFSQLAAEGVDLVFGDGELRYLPDPTLSPTLSTCGLDEDIVRCPHSDSFAPPSGGQMVRPGSFNLMSHNFFVIDTHTTFQFSAPFRAGSTPDLGWRMESETIRDVFVREFSQLHAGVFSANLDIYNGPIKSAPQRRATYQTDQGEFELRFNPQERLVKSIIDQIYSARSSVFVMTDNLDDEFLLDALAYKKNNDFDVRIVIHDDHQGSLTNDRLDDLGAKRIETGTDSIPTVVVIDSEVDRRGRSGARRAYVVSHPLWRSAAFSIFTSEPNDIVEVYRSDTFIDGTSWGLVENIAHRSSQIDDLLGYFSRVYQGAS